MEENNMSHEEFYMWNGFAYSVTMVIVVNGFLAICYSLKHPWIERYKCIDGPWPWDEDKEEWAKLLKKSLWIYTLNALVISPLTFTIHHATGDPVFFDKSMEGIPGSV